MQTDLDEFLTFVMEFSDVALDPDMKDTLDLIVEAWGEMDADGSGCVSKDEFFTYFKGMGFSEEHCEEKWKLADINGDGTLSLVEFWQNCISG